MKIRTIEELLETKVEDGELLQSYANTVHRVQTSQGKYILKLYKSRERFTDEIRTLRLLHGSVVPVSEVIETGEYEGKPYAVFSVLEGERLDQRITLLGVKQRQRVSANIGRTLAGIHAYPYPNFDKLVEGRFVPYSSWKERFMVGSEGLLRANQGAETLPREVIQRVCTFFEESEDLLDAETEPVLVHNDFWAGNILVTGEEITGIVDFEWSNSSPVSYDFVKLYRWHIPQTLDEEHLLGAYAEHKTLPVHFREALDLYTVLQDLHFLLVLKGSNSKDLQEYQRKFMESFH